MRESSKTDWARLTKMSNTDIDTSDILELDDAFFTNAVISLPGKKPVTLRLDEDVLAWFKAGGAGYQTRINKLLRHYMEAQR